MFTNEIYFWLICIERCRNADDNQDLEFNDAYLVKLDVLLMVDVLIYRLEGTLVIDRRRSGMFQSYMAIYHVSHTPRFLI